MQYNVKDVSSIFALIVNYIYSISILINKKKMLIEINLIF